MESFDVQHINLW